MARKDSENQKKLMSRVFRGKEIFKPLNTGWIDERVAEIRYSRLKQLEDDIKNIQQQLLAHLVWLATAVGYS